MKKIFVTVMLTGIAAIHLSAQTVDEVISKFETASGGKDKLEAVKSLQVESNMKMSMMGQSLDISINSIKEKGKLYRRQMGGVMGMGSSFTLITDTAGYVFIPAMPSFGGGGFGGGTPPQQSGPIVNKLTQEELSKQQFELDCAGANAPLVNYAAKGYKAELLGTAKANKQECYKVKLTLNNGQFITYYISTKDFLVTQLDASGEMAANLTGMGSMMKVFGTDTRSLRLSMKFSDYKEFGGIQYPTKQVIAFGAAEFPIDNSDVKVNEAVDAVWYKVK